MKYIHTKYNKTNPYICFQVFSAPPAFSFTPTQLDTNHNNIKIEYVLSYMKININCKLLIDFLPSCYHDLHNQGFQSAQYVKTMTSAFFSIWWKHLLYHFSISSPLFQTFQTKTLDENLHTKFQNQWKFIKIGNIIK